MHNNEVIVRKIKKLPNYNILDLNKYESLED